MYYLWWSGAHAFCLSVFSGRFRNPGRVARRSRRSCPDTRRVGISTRRDGGRRDHPCRHRAAAPAHVRALGLPRLRPGPDGAGAARARSRRRVAAGRPHPHSSLRRVLRAPQIWVARRRSSLLRFDRGRIRSHPGDHPRAFPVNPAGRHRADLCAQARGHRRRPGCISLPRILHRLDIGRGTGQLTRPALPSDNAYQMGDRRAAGADIMTRSEDSLLGSDSLRTWICLRLGPPSTSRRDRSGSGAGPCRHASQSTVVAYG